MFENLKTKRGLSEKYEDREDAGMYPSRGLSPSPGVSSFGIFGDEASRLVRCKICGFPCDKTRDGMAEYDTWAGLGISYSDQKTADASIGDVKTPAAGTVTPTPDRYYDRTIVSGCPCCGSMIYDK